jgi:hypothetical protein
LIATFGGRREDGEDRSIHTERLKALGCGLRFGMAQWMGQYSGNTHKTRVEDLEAALRQAVHAFRMTISEPERRKKAKSIRNLAKRLLSARRHMLRARVAATEVFAQRGREIESLREREAAAAEEGVLGILAEFDAQDAMTA